MKNRNTVLILGAAQFIMVLDTTVMNVSITQVVEDLDTSVSAVQAAITLYALVMAAFMLTGAKLGDMFGRRRIFGIGLAIYGTGSLITAISPSVPILYIGWSGIEGIGAVLVIPAIAALTAANYHGKERAAAFALIGGIAGAGVALGPLIGGFVTSAWTWRIVFAGETVVVALILVFGLKRITDSAALERKKLDIVGAALSALGLGLFVFGVLKSSSWGLLTPSGALTVNGTEITPFGLSVVPFIVAAGFLVLIAFRRWEERVLEAGREPLLRPDLLSIPRLRAAMSMLTSSYLIMAGTFFVIPLYLQLVLGKDAFETGVALMPVSLAMVATAIGGGRLSSRVAPRRIVNVGLLITGISLFGVFASIDPDLTSPLFSISLAGFGAGFGLVISQLSNVAMSAVDESRTSEVGGVQGSAQSLGTALGTALIGAVLLSSLTGGFHDNVNSNPAIPPDVAEQLTTGTQDGLEMVSEEQARQIVDDAGLPPDQADAIVDDYNESQLDALKRALAAAALFSLVAIWFSGDLPREPMEATDPAADDAAPVTA